MTFVVKCYTLTGDFMGYTAKDGNVNTFTKDISTAQTFDSEEQAQREMSGHVFAMFGASFEIEELKNE